MIRFYFFLFLVFPFSMAAQFTDAIQLPVVHAPQWRVYISPSGNNLAQGDSVAPVATFVRALEKLDSLSSGMSGDVYGEIVFYPGVYPFAAEQPVNKYQIGAKRLNVGIRGKGLVQLDGTGVTLGGGSAMIRLLGSNISVKNFEVLYSPANGVFFGFDYNGTVINPHDISVEDVTVQQVGGHGILVGIGHLNTANPLVLTLPGERFLIRNCTVRYSINFNDTTALQWGSCIKMHNAKHVTVANCLVHDNAGEGIGVDGSQYIDIRDNVVFDNRANIYLDKADHIIIRNNLIYYTHRALPKRDTGYRI